MTTLRNVLAVLVLTAIVTSMCIVPVIASGVHIKEDAYGWHHDEAKPAATSQAGNGNTPTIIGDGNTVNNNQVTYNVILEDKTNTQTTSTPQAYYPQTATTPYVATQPAQQTYSQPAAATYPVQPTDNGWYCDMPYATTDKIISFFVWGPYTFNKREVDKLNWRTKLTDCAARAAQSLAGKSQVTPDELKTALKQAGWDGPMWIAAVPAQDIQVSFPGQAPGTQFQPAAYILITTAVETINGNDAIDIISLELTANGVRQDVNGWVPVKENAFSPVINKVTATKFWQVA